VNGVTMALADLVGLAAVGTTVQIPTPPVKTPSQWTIIGKPQPRVDAQAIVTGQKQFAMDLDVPDAMPTMLCRPPTINGVPLAIRNLSTVLAFPGVTDVAIIPRTDYVPGGVGVRARTFGECITAIRALDVQWGPGSVDDKSADDVAADLAWNELPMLPALLADHIEDKFTFHFRPGDPLETNCAVATFGAGGIEVWACMKTPIWVREQLALNHGLPIDKVIAHVVEGGGSFGRHLYADAAFEAVSCARIFGKPVKLMWHRTDNFRQGRVHPMATSRVRITYGGGLVLAYDQRHTSVATDFTHGFGELLTAMGATFPLVNSLGYSETIFTLTQNVPYNFGPATQLLREIYSYNHFNTSSVRNIYSPDVATAREVMVDRAARAMGQDEYKFRRSFCRDDRLRAVLDVAAQQGNWGRPMAPGTAQGMAVHMEYKGRAAALVEIDCTAATVHRDVPDAYTGPRVTKVVYVVDVGLPINPMGLEAQMMGGIMDGIAQCLSYSLHLEKGAFLEGSWDNAFYTRQWNVPPEVKVIIMPPTSLDPGGAGEFGVAATMAAVANAYARATGVAVNSFPLNHGDQLNFVPLPTIPSIPESPTDGLSKAY
jgi:isoquinoline 1-oxidoreductase beta subunit